MVDINKLFGTVKLTDLEKNILNYLIEDPDKSINLGIRTIAKEIYTSPATIVRLAKKLGYSGFVELVYSIKNKVSKNKSYDTLKNLDHIHLYTTNYKNAADDFVKYLKEGSFLVCGEGFSEIVSKYIYMKLLVIGKRAIFSSFIDFDILFENNYKDIKYILLISKSGEGSHCVNTYLYAKERNVKVISFTGNENSTLAKNSDISFIIPDVEKSDSDNYYPNLFFGYCIETFEVLMHKYFLSEDMNSK